MIGTWSQQKQCLRLDNESSWYRRIISEMIHIKTQSNGLNKQSDTEMLSDSYNLIIHKLKSE